MVAAILAGVVALAARGDEVPFVDFVRDVRPILRGSCTGCHGAKKQEGDLRLDGRDSAMEGGLSGPVIVPGKSGESRLFKLVAGQGGKLAMPPDPKARLDDRTVGLLRAWIDAGAPWPDVAAAGDDATPEHWAYRPPARPDLPAVGDPAWVRNPIDAFVLARLDAEHLAPSPEADKAVLLRRVALDLTGLPPSPAEVDAFLADTRPDAYVRQVDRLLASPHYGERWARLWLDLARYADTHGFEKDPRRSIWPYRDWVIDAMNRDLPFDRFTVDQIAGDMVPGAKTDQLVASGFHRNTMTNTEGGVDPEEARVATVVDRVNTTATVWLGSTLACAQCHTHKFDPFQQKEYYQFFAFFDSTDEPETVVSPRDVVARRDAIASEVDVLSRELEAYRGTLAGRRAGWEAGLSPESRAGLTTEAMAALVVAEAGRSDDQKKAILAAFAALDPGIPARESAIAALAARMPAIHTSMTMRQLPTPRETRIHLRGNFLTKGEAITPGVPAIFPPLPPGMPADRLALAKWLVAADNPLTGRVIVNRFWEQYFGRGLVGTVEDFGTQGEAPTHPELLDWLATEFPRRGWSMKALHRLIVTSATYRQSSRVTADRRAADPDNRLLARGPRVRVEAEMVRDIALAASGLLSRKVGGPSVFPPQPEGIWTMIYSSDRWETSVGADRYRRGLYTFWRRTAPYPTFMAFDAPTREFACIRRARTNTPLQALATLNDPAFVEAAQALGRRIVAEGGSDPRSRAAYGLRLCVARVPRPAEVDRLVALFDQERTRFEADAPAAARMVGSADSPDLAEGAAWAVVANVLLNLDETITKE